MDSYTIVVSDRVVRKELNSESIEYLIVYAKSSQGLAFPKVERTYRDFLSLEIALNNNIRANNVECPTLDSHQTNIRADGPWSTHSLEEKDLNINEKIQNVKKFCKTISSDVNFQTEPFFDFFGIPKPEQEDRGRRQSEIEIKESGLSFAQMNEGIPNLWTHFESENLEDYCPYFRTVFHKRIISKNEHNFFEFRIQSLLDQRVDVEICKRYSEFLDLATRLKDIVRVGLPALPPKLIIKDRAHLLKRGEALLDWLQVVINERLYFCRELFEFINLGHEEYLEYTNANFVAKVMENCMVKLQIRGHQTVQDEIDNFVIYEIDQQYVCKSTLEHLKGYKANRRFKEFDILLHHLKHKFKRYKFSWPELTGGKSYLMGRENSDERQTKLEIFIKELASFSEVFECVAFRQFILLDNTKLQALTPKRGTQVF